MRFFDLTLPTLAENLACDEALLLDAEAGDGAECLRLWEWTQPAVVLGAAGILHADVEVAACERDQVEVNRRSSGGGTVLLDHGCLLFSLIFAYDHADDLTRIGCSYCFILGRIRQALSSEINGIDLAGTSDMTLGERKFSGNSQQRKRRFLLHHGAILYNADLKVMGQYLRMPKRQPDYRHQRSHDDFLVNLPLQRETICECLQRAWRAEDASPQLPTEQIQLLVTDKYSLDSWRHRR